MIYIILAVSAVTVIGYYIYTKNRAGSSVSKADDDTTQKDDKTENQLDSGQSNEEVLPKSTDANENDSDNRDPPQLTPLEIETSAVPCQMEASANSPSILRNGTSGNFKKVVTWQISEEEPPTSELKFYENDEKFVEDATVDDSTSKSQPEEENKENAPPQQSLQRSETMFESADVITYVSRMNICCGIFKNPADHRTHYYRKRYKALPPIPTEVRNIVASFRVWGQHWERIQNIKIFQKLGAVEQSEWNERLLGEADKCQQTFGCQISINDFNSLSNIDKKVLGDLLNKVHNNCVSEDDEVYFNMQNDSDSFDKVHFDL